MSQVHIVENTVFFEVDGEVYLVGTVQNKKIKWHSFSNFVPSVIKRKISLAIR